MPQNPNDPKVKAYYRKQRLTDTAKAEDGDVKARNELKKIIRKTPSAGKNVPKEVLNGTAFARPGASEGDQMFSLALGAEGGIGAARGLAGTLGKGLIEGAGKSIAKKAGSLAARLFPRAADDADDTVAAAARKKLTSRARNVVKQDRTARSSTNRIAAGKVKPDSDRPLTKRATPRGKGTDRRSQLRVDSKGNVAKGSHPRASGTNPRASGTNPRALAKKAAEAAKKAAPAAKKTAAKSAVKAAVKKASKKT